MKNVIFIIVDTEKLWAEHRNTEGLDIPFRLGYEFDVHSLAAF